MSAMWLCLVGPTLAQECAAGRIDQTARAARVLDGDTLVLADGRHLRLIGIDAPELGRDGAPAEPLAEAARAALAELLDGAPALGLQFDAQAADNYRRALAHVYLPDGANVAAALLERGLATAWAIPPNLAQAACYRALERGARQSGAGLWGLPAFAPRESTSLAATAHGYHLLRGEVLEVQATSRSVYLQLAGGVALRIDRADLGYFAPLPLDRLRGRRLQVGGWVYGRRGAPVLRVRHPLAWELLN